MVCIAIAIMFMLAMSVQAQQADKTFCPTEIDTRLGTAVSRTLTAGRFGQGTEEYAHVLPAVLEPNGMNFWTPQTCGDTEKKGVCPYTYEEGENSFRGFRSSHWIVGGCTQDYGSFTILPLCVKPDTLRDYSAHFLHDEGWETARPYLYEVRLVSGNDTIDASLTARSRTAILSFTFSNPDSAYVVLTSNSDEAMGVTGIDLNRKLMWGENPVHRIYQGKGKAAGFSGWCVVRYQDEIERSGRLDANRIWVKFKPKKGAEKMNVTLKMATSFVSVDGAMRNMETEIPHWDFATTQHELHDIWQKTFARIEVSHETNEGDGVTAVSDHDCDLLTQFYTALYHASFLPHITNDVDGSYPTFANGTPRNDNTLRDFHTMLTLFDYYDDFSLWDTYRALHPLLTIIAPQRDGEMMQSLVAKYLQGGWMPIFPCWNSYTAAMIGDHVASVIADAYVKGVRNFDVVNAYKGLRQNAFESPKTYEEYCDGKGRRALESYLRYGFIPLEDSVKEAYHQHEQVSRTLEYAYDDYALAQFAKGLIESPYTPLELSKNQLRKDYNALMKRSRNWRNVIDPETGYANGRHADGEFVTPADTQYIKEPEKHPEVHALTPSTFSTFITEGVPWHYSWYVPHDVPGLIKAMGGKDAFEAKLDSMQTLYWHGNEPCHQIAYLYNYIGKPHKTQQAVRHILATEYASSPHGLSGNDDAGQMSAWYIFSSLGFYPVCPATDKYALGSPVFPRAVINLENGRTFTITAENASPQNIYVKSVTLNGKKLSSPFISHESIMQGGELHFVMSDKLK